MEKIFAFLFFDRIYFNTDTRLTISTWVNTSKKKKEKLYQLMNIILLFIIYEYKLFIFIFTHKIYVYKIFTKY